MAKQIHGPPPHLQHPSIASILNLDTGTNHNLHEHQQLQQIEDVSIMDLWIIF